MTANFNITRRVRRRKLQGGAAVQYTRYVLNYRHPTTGQRRQEFFERAKDAQARRSELQGHVAAGTYVDERTVPTVADALDHWLADRAGNVKASTLGGHKVVVKHIRGPILAGSPEQRAAYAVSGKVPKGAKLLPMLGSAKLNELTTAAI